MRLSRGQTPVQKEAIDLSFHPDNIRWQEDGSLLATGLGAPSLTRAFECLWTVCSDVWSSVVKIDPETLSVDELVRYPATEKFYSATSALRVGQDIWIGSFRGDRIAIYPAP